MKNIILSLALTALSGHAYSSETAVQHLAVKCSDNHLTTHLLMKGEMHTLIEGTIVADMAKEKLPQVEGMKKTSIDVDLKYSVKMDQKTMSSEDIVGVAEGEIKNADATLYKPLDENSVKFTVNSNNSSLTMVYHDKTGWIASLKTTFDDSLSTEEMQGQNMKISIACTVHRI